MPAMQRSAPERAMTNETTTSGDVHARLIREQFTRQAAPFSTARPIADPGALKAIVDAAAPGPDDTVLDVACGGGLVVCAFAPHVRHATGIDMTPAMLDRARALAAEQRIANVSWQEGDVTALPWADGAFSVVVTRFAVHHFRDPLVVLREMIRTCAPGGRIVVVDTCASSDPDRAARFNRLEKLRDPSHVRALPLAELEGLFRQAGLGAPGVTRSELRDTVDNLLARSFPNDGDAEKIVAMFAAAAEDDSLGIPVRRLGERLEYAYPVAILAAERH
jgi:SAM-dependent methyltransferase